MFLKNMIAHFVKFNSMDIHSMSINSYDFNQERNVLESILILPQVKNCSSLSLASVSQNTHFFNIRNKHIRNMRLKSGKSKQTFRKHRQAELH